MAAPDRLLAEATPLAVRIAALAGPRLLELHIDRPGIRVGDVFAGRVRRVSPALDGAFVALGAAGDGLLRAADVIAAVTDSGATGPLSARLHEGQRLAVAIQLAAHNDKGPLLTQRFEDPGAALAAAAQAGPPRLLRRAAPLLQRLAARHPQAAIVAEGAAPAQLRGLANRAVPHHARAPLFEQAGVEEQLAAALAPELALPSGARLRFEPTRTLTAIDLDSAAASARSGAAINLEAVPVLARQLRLRNLAGLIAVDFLAASRREGRRLMAALAAALADDPAQIALEGPSRFALVQIARQRLGPSLAQASGPPAQAAAEALARRLSREARAGPAAAFQVRATPQVVAALLGADGGAGLARWLGRPVLARAEAGRAHGDFAIAPACA